MSLPEGDIKNELRKFTKKGEKSFSNINEICLAEVQLKKCSDTFAIFENGNFIANNIIIEIETKIIGDGSSVLKEIYVLPYKWGYNLPDSAIKDIKNPILCTKFTKKDKPIERSCKVLRSNDKRRVYIYLMFVYSDRKYEVTWIIKNNIYYGRVIDLID